MLTKFHYFKKSLEWYEENGELVPKITNPPNFPEQRVNQNYWSVIKGILL